MDPPFVKLPTPCVICGNFEKYIKSNAKSTIWVCFICGDNMFDIEGDCCYIKASTFKEAKEMLRLKGIK